MRRGLPPANLGSCDEPTVDRRLREQPTDTPATPSVALRLMILRRRNPGVHLAEGKYLVSVCERRDAL